MDPGRSELTSQKESPDRHALEPESPDSVEEDLCTLLESCRETTLVAVAVDPYVVHCQWDVAPGDLENAQRALGVGDQEFWPVLRFYDVTNAAPEEALPEPSFAVEVQLQAGNWFVRSCAPERAYRANLALKTEDGSFAVMASSNPVQTPPSTPSNSMDEHWLPIRMGPGEPERATPARPSINLVLEPPLAEPSQPRVPAVRLPIGMREEVRGGMATLNQARGREALEPPLPGQSPLPIDMREEVRKLLTRLYPGLEEESALAGGLILMEEHRMERVFRESAAVLYSMKPGARADLTELNERSFASGVSSRTK